MVHIREITKVPTLPGNTLGDLYHRSLESALRFILRARFAEVWEFNSDSSIQIAARMESNFTFRQMCVPRRLLEIPGHRRYIFWEQIQTQKTFSLPHAKEIIVAPFGKHFAERSKTGVLLVVTMIAGNPDPKNLIFLKSMSIALAEVNKCMNLRWKRTCARTHTLKSVRLLCMKPHLPMDEIEAGLISAMTRCLPASRAIIGFAQNGGESIRLLDYDEQRTDRNLLFCCLPPTLASSVVIRDKFERSKEFLSGTPIQVRHGKALYGAVLAANRGHLHYDVKYHTKDWMGRFQQEAGVSITRLHHLAQQPKHLPAFMANTADVRPIFVVPLSCGRGVIIFDSWSSMNPEPKRDENSIKMFLREIGKYFGSFIDDKIRGSSLRILCTPAEASTLPTETTNACLNHTKLCQLQGLVATDLPDLERRTSTDVLRRCHALSDLVSCGLGIILVQANILHTVFLSLFEDRSAKKPSSLLESPNLHARCSSKYKAISWEDMAFSSKISELISLRDEINATTNKNCTILASVLESIRTVCGGCFSLANIIRHAIRGISKAMWPMDLYVAYILPQGVVSIRSSSGMPADMSVQQWNLFAHMIFQASVTRQLVLENHSNKRIAKLLICVPVTLDANLPRVALLLTTKETCKGMLKASCVNFLEAATVFLGSAVDTYCKKCELLRLRKLSTHLFSKRNIIRLGLAAIDHQLIHRSRISIWQLQRTSICARNKHLMLSLDLDKVNSTSSLKSSIVAIVYSNGVLIGTTSGEGTPFDAPTRIHFGCRRFTFAMALNSLNVELWQTTKCVSWYGIVKLLGVLELDRKSLLLTAAGITCPLADINHNPLKGSIDLSCRLKVHLPSNRRACFVQKYHFAHGDRNRAAAEDERSTVLVEAMVAYGSLAPGQYTCVFLDDQGLELGRTPLTHGSSTLEWTNLRICVSLTETCRLMRAELRFLLQGKPPQTLATSDLSDACLVHLPRNRLEVKMRMSASQFQQQGPGSKRDLPKKIVLGLRLEKLQSSTQSCSVSPCQLKLESPRLTSSTRITNGIVDFGNASIDTSAEIVSIAAAACERGSPCLGSRDNIFIVPFEDLIQTRNNFDRAATAANFTMVVSVGPESTTRENLAFLCDVARAMEIALGYRRLCELRDVLKLDASTQISIMCESWMARRLPDVFDATLQMLSHCLPGCGMYVSLLQPGGNELVCVACNSQSRMCGRVLRCGCDTNFIVENWIEMLVASHSMLPYACAPLTYNGSVYGVLSVDAFNYSCDKSVHISFEPREDFILHLLQHVGASVGKAVDARRKSDALALLKKSASNVEQSYKLAMRAICSTVHIVDACQMVELDSERQFYRVLSATALIKTSPESLQTPLLSHMVLGKLLNTAMHGKILQLVSLDSRHLVIPVARGPAVRVLVVQIIEQLELTRLAASYLLTIVKSIS
mmetsp:Transcript_6896/g.21716  ORF Transcript_6896/g.21716 Transcript_6896/m.21716 type:complete len:1426 (+) Transcript_6896:1382-5659(+)